MRELKANYGIKSILGRELLLMKKKFSLMGRVAIALVLALSLSLVMAVPVAAAHTVILTSDVAGSTPGESKTITVTVENTGAVAINKVVIDIPPVGTDGSTWDVTEFNAEKPVGWEVAVATDAFGDRVNTLTYDNSTIEAAASEDFTFTATAPDWAADYVFTVTTTDTVPDELVSDFTITVDGTSPVLSSIAWTDEGAGSTDIDAGDTLLFTFSEDIDPLTVDDTNIDSRLPTSGGHTYGTLPAVDWGTPVGNDTLTVTLGTDPTIVSGDTVDPTDDVTDVAGNPDATVPVEEEPYLPTIEDDVEPFLNAIEWDDVDDSTALNAGDTLMFTFSEAMDTTTVAVGTLGSRLPLSVGSYGDGATIAWATDGKILTVTVGTNVSILDLATVDPDPLVTDAAGNPDNTISLPEFIENVGPRLLSITWNDVDSSAAVNAGDSLVFIFSEKMDTTTIDHASIGTVLPTVPAHNYGSLISEDVTWSAPDNYILTVTLGTGTTIQPNDTVKPTAAVKDISNNPDETDGVGPPIAQVTVNVDAPATVVKGESFVATLNITDVTGLDAATYNVMFDSTILELTGVTDGTVGTTAIPVGATTDILDESDVLIGVRVSQNVSGTEGVSGSGTLAELNFTFIGNSGEYSDINLEETMLSDKDANEIYANWFGDSVAATALVGDANGDGSLNALDITYIERCVSGDTNYPETDGADANGDTFYNALDITKVEILVGEA